jgi:hypothetical protein
MPCAQRKKGCLPARRAGNTTESAHGYDPGQIHKLDIYLQNQVLFKRQIMKNSQAAHFVYGPTAEGKSTFATRFDAMELYLEQPTANALRRSVVISDGIEHG